MLKHFIIQFLRTVKRDKLTFFINFAGLGIGLTCIFVIFLWINDELNIDRFHEKDSRIYSVFRNRVRPNGVIETGKGAPSPLAHALKNEFPEVEHAVAVNYMTISRDGSTGVLSVGNNEIKVNGQFAGKDYFHVFSYPLIQGDKNTVLTNKNGIVITEALAKKIFNTTDNVIGKTIKYKHQLFENTFQVDGICQNPPSNSTIQFDIIFNYGILLDLEPNAKKWTGSYADTYLVLKKDTNIEDFNNKIKDFIQLKHPRNKNRTLFVQQFSKNYLYGNFENGKQAGGRIYYVKLFSIIALFILVIACANFMNLSTAKASSRIKEIGIKKALGVERKSLIIQFVGESLMMTVVSSIFSISFTELLLPLFKDILGKNLTFDFGLTNVLFVLAIVLLTGLISGCYPAIYLSRFNPICTIKGINHSTSGGEAIVRKGLVIVQFVIAVVFITVFLGINKQVNLIQTKSLGYDSDNVIILERRGRGTNFKTFLTELKKIPGVENASSMNNNMLQVRNTSRLDSWEGKIPDDNTAIIPYPSINYDFIETMGIKIKEGRSFSREYTNEKTKVILNESAVKMMGFKKPIGKTINIDRQDKVIIGVVKNFHFETLYKNIEPLALKFSEYGGYIYVKLKSGEEKATIERIKKLYEEFQDFPFEFSYLNDTYQVLYESEVRLGSLVNYASVITIIISCLGLFGLAAFASQKRFKEICIRKILGSSVFGIMTLLLYDYTKLLILSIVIALPMGYLIISNWLNQFANRITTGWWFFIEPCLIILFLSWFTVGIQILKVANVNPAIGLRYE